MNGCLILSDAFSASIEMTIWFSFFSLLKSGEFHYIFNAVTTLWYGSLMRRVSTDFVSYWDLRISCTSFFDFFLFRYGLLQDIEYNSLCYTVGLCLSILYIVVCISASRKCLLHPFSTPFPSLVNITLFFYVSVCMCPGAYFINIKQQC